MQLMGESVCHARFGQGKVVRVEPKRITVSFPEPYGEKCFIYPDAFEHFLTVEDAAVSAQLEQAIVQRDAELARKKHELEERIKAYAQQAADEKAQERASSRSRARKAPARAR